MSDYELPDLPSDEELGITEEDVEKYGDQLPDDGPEMSEEEMAALLGGTTASTPAAKAPASGESRADRRAAKKKAKEAKKQAKEAEKRARAAEKAAAAEKQASAKAASAGAAGGAPASGETGAPDASEAPQGGPDPAADAAGQPRAKKAAAASGGPPALAPMPAWRGPATLIFLLVLALFASTRTGQVSPGPTNAPDDAFSSARAMAILTDIARAPHPPGSPEHARVRGLLIERLEQLGFETEVHTATTVIEGGPAGRPGFARAATVRNIVATRPGSDPSGTVLITAHYDSRGIAVGAGDDGSGIVTILESLRALRTGPPLRNNLIVLLTDAEELGLMGARAFVDEHPLMPEVDLVLSFEMRGGGGPSIMFETNERNGWVVRAFQSFAPAPFANSMAHEVYRRMPNDTDFTPFREAGVQGLNFAAIDNAHVYHQSYDAVDNLSESTVQHHGLQALAALRHFGNEDLTLVNDGNVVFFTLPVVGLVVYRQFWVLPISLGLVVLFLLCISVARGGGARTGRIVVACLLSLALGALAYFFGDTTFGQLRGLHPEYGALHGSSFHSEGWYVMALAFTAMLLVTGTVVLVRRWVAPLELAVGALVLPVVAAVAASFAAPLAAMNLQWPVAAALVAVTVMALLKTRASGLVGWLVFLALTVPVFLFLQPVLELLWLAMTFEVAGVLTVIAVFGFLLSLPLLGSLEAPNRWWAPASALALAAACMTAGVFSAAPSAERPAPSTLLYAYEHGASEAMWVTDPEAVTEENDPAHAWAEARAGVAFEELQSLDAFGMPIELAVAPARVLLVEPPEVAIAADTVLGGARRLVVEVRSRIGAEALVVALDGETRLTGVNGQPVSDVEGIRWLSHWGTPDTTLVLDLSMPPDALADIHFVEHLLRPQELLGRDSFRRPPELAPNVNRSSDRALFRSRFSDPRAPDAAAPPTNVVTPPPDAGVPDSVIRLRTDTLAVPDTGTAAVPDTGSAGPREAGSLAIPLEDPRGPA